MLTAYYKIYPQGDDRPHKYLSNVKIGLDIDEVLSDFVGAMLERFPKMGKRSAYWNDYHISDNFNEIKEDTKFWENIKPKITSIPFEPHCYITSRPIGNEVTEKWLAKHNFKYHGILFGKPRGGNYHWIDNHIVKATRFKGKFTDLVVQHKKIEVFKS